MTTTQEITKLMFNVTEITVDEIRAENREYNPREWDKTIDRYLKYEGVKFYKAEPQRGYSYVKYFVVYQLPEGIIFMGEVSYSSCLSSGGFAQVVIVANQQVYRKLLSDGKGNWGYGGTDNANRAIMAKNSRTHGTIYSKCF